MPARIEIGPKDVAKGSVALARRDILGREGKQFIPQAGIVETITDLLVTIQASLLQSATEYRDANIHPAKDLKELVAIVEAGGWAAMPADGSREVEEQIKEACKAAALGFPIEAEPLPAGTKDPISGRDAIGLCYFSRKY